MGLMKSKSVDGGDLETSDDGSERSSVASRRRRRLPPTSVTWETGNIIIVLLIVSDLRPQLTTGRGNADVVVATNVERLSPTAADSESVGFRRVCGVFAGGRGSVDAEPEMERQRRRRRTPPDVVATRAAQYAAEADRQTVAQDQAARRDDADGGASTVARGSPSEFGVGRRHPRDQLPRSTGLSTPPLQPSASSP